MKRLIQQASYWTYKAPPTPAEAPPGMAGDWQSLSPGMRREIWRSYERLQRQREREAIARMKGEVS